MSKYLDARGQKLRLEVFKSVASTNELVKALASGGESEGKVILSEEQTAGRGRKGRPFFSPAGTGIYMSILLRPRLSAADATLLTTSAAVAVALAIESVSDLSTQIKWVNDVFMNGKKVCGILTEASLSLESEWLDYAVLGIGINVTLPSGGFPAELSEVATSIYQAGNPEGDLRNRLTAEVLNRFMAYYEQLKERLFLPDYRQRMMSLGETIMVVKEHQEQPATAVDIDNDCRLKVRYPNGEEEYLSSGEVRILL